MKGLRNETRWLAECAPLSPIATVLNVTVLTCVNVQIVLLIFMRQVFEVEGTIPFARQYYFSETFSLSTSFDKNREKGTT